MKTKVYTYSKLISGNTLARNYHNRKINDILSSGKGKEELTYHQTWKAYFDDTIQRQSLQRKVCGDVVVLYA